MPHVDDSKGSATAGRGDGSVHPTSDNAEREPSQTFTSPIGHVRFDQVQKVSKRVKLAQQGGSFEVAIPLKVLGLKAKDLQAGATTIGDIGVLIGEGGDTRARLYWNNQAAQTTADLPSEARLQPQEWGTWRFQAE